VTAWIKKAWSSAVDGTTVVARVPVHSATGWWWDGCGCRLVGVAAEPASDARSMR
jgi:hypothetical protein